MNSDQSCSCKREVDEKHKKHVKINPIASGISQEQIIILLFFIKSDPVVVGDGESQCS